MAIIQNPVIGRAKKKMGNVVFSKNFGKNIMRSKPVEVKNPRTASQVAQRGTFKAALIVVKEFLPAIRIGWKSLAINKSACAMCMSDTLLNSMKNVSGVTSVDITKFKISKGSLDTFNDEVWSRPTTNTIKVTWNPSDILPSAAGTDIIHICVCNPIMSVVQIFLNAAVRSSGTTTITLRPNLASAVHVYCFAFTQSVSNKNLVGNTQRSGAL